MGNNREEACWHEAMEALIHRKLKRKSRDMKIPIYTKKHIIILILLIASICYDKKLREHFEIFVKKGSA